MKVNVQILPGSDPLLHLTLRLKTSVLASVPVSGLQSSPGQSNRRGSAVRGSRPRRCASTSSCMMLVFYTRD